MFAISFRSRSELVASLVDVLVALDQVGERCVDDVAARRVVSWATRSDIIDAALTHLIESYENIDEARDEFAPGTIKEIANTSVIGLNYRTSIESKWR